MIILISNIYSSTDPKRKARKPSHHIPLMHLNKFHHFAGHNQSIIIFSLTTALIPLHNVKRFLGDSVYVSLYTPPSIPFLSHPKSQKCSFEPLQEAHARRQPQTSSPSTANAPRSTAVEENSYAAHLFRRGPCPSLARTLGRGWCV